MALVDEVDYQPGVCFAVGCGREVDADKLMCRPHWFAVPAPIRSAVWTALIRHGALSEQWWQAVTAAREAIR